MIVDRPYWLETFENEVDFEIGETRAVVLGTYHGHEWTVPRNPNRLSRKDVDWNFNFEERQERTFRVSSKMEVEVSVISRKTGTTLAHQVVYLDFADDEAFTAKLV